MLISMFYVLLKLREPKGLVAPKGLQFQMNKARVVEISS